MTGKTEPKPSKEVADRRSFTVRETLRAKHGYDGAASIIRRMYDRTTKEKGKES